MNHRRRIGAAMVVVGLPVMIWASGGYAIAGAVLAILGLGLLATRKSGAGVGPASSSPHTDLLWRGSTGGPPNPPKDSGMNYPRI